MNKEASDRVSSILGRLDTIAHEIQANHETWGMDFDAAKSIVNTIDGVQDHIEKEAFGEESFQARQAEVIRKTAQVIQKDNDEPYMSSFDVDQGVVQQDADEPYMSAYTDDQSSAVRHGKDVANDPLAPGHQNS